MKAIQRIHHISAIVGNAQENLNFYRDVMGLKLIKKTLNFEDKAVYHLYFSNHEANPNFVLTFFNWDLNFKGRKGSGQIGRIALSIPKGTMSQWEHYLFAKGIDSHQSLMFNKKALYFEDPHSLALALIETNEVRDNRAIIGFYGTELLSAYPERTKQLLLNDMKLNEVEPNVYETYGEEKHAVSIVQTPLEHGRFGIGTVHHIAWHVEDHAELLAWQEHFYQKKLSISEIKDRKYFMATYLQEPGNMVFEFATDGPGFQVDESFEELGQTLLIPPHYEENREDILAQIKPIV